MPSGSLSHFNRIVHACMSTLMKQAWLSVMRMVMAPSRQMRTAPPLALKMQKAMEMSLQRRSAQVMASRKRMAKAMRKPQHLHLLMGSEKRKVTLMALKNWRSMCSLTS